MHWILQHHKIWKGKFEHISVKMEVYTTNQHRVSAELLTLLSNRLVFGESRNQSNITQLIIEELVQKTLAPVNIDYTNTQYISNMLDIFQQLAADATFIGRSLMVEAMKSFAYSLLEGSECDAPPLTHTRPLFYLEAVKLSPSSLAGRQFAFNNGGDYVQLPNQVSAMQVHTYYFTFSCSANN